MRQVAIFADAGYLHTGGAIALTGSSQQRAGMELKLPETIAKLETTARERANGIPLLRIYWYDGLLLRHPSQEQESLANTDNVKVRLGTVTAGQQKGVDSLIVTDLIELARNQAISDAVLLSGDEDLRIGVQIAQSFGVRVHLIGIEPSRGNQSRLLRQEADTTGEWSKGEVEEILSLKPGMWAIPGASQTPLAPCESEESYSEALDHIAYSIVNSISETTMSETKEALSQTPFSIPHDYDRRLLSMGRIRMGRDLDDSEKLRIRNKFREFVTKGS